MNTLLFFQNDAITQPEELVAPEVIIGAAIVLVSILTSFFVWLMMIRISFFKKAIETDGKVIGLLSATHKGQTSANIPYVGKIESNDSDASGYLLSIEYETDDFVYQTKSKKTYSNYRQGDTIPIFYNPDDPEDCSVDGIYEVNPKLGYAVLAIGGTAIIALIVVMILV